MAGSQLLEKPSAAEVARKAIAQRRTMWKAIVASAGSNPRRKDYNIGDDNTLPGLEGYSSHSGSTRSVVTNDARPMNPTGKSRVRTEKRWLCICVSISPTSTNDEKQYPALHPLVILGLWHYVEACTVSNVVQEFHTLKLLRRGRDEV